MKHHIQGLVPIFTLTFRCTINSLVETQCTETVGIQMTLCDI